MFILFLFINTDNIGDIMFQGLKPYEREESKWISGNIMISHIKNT